MTTFSDKVAYKEFKPDYRLQPYIAHYWEIKSTEPLDRRFMFRVVADGCIDLVFVPANSAFNFISGFSPTYEEFPVSNHFHFFWVTFYPGMFPQLFNIPIHELTSEMGDLECIVPRTADYLNKSISPE